MGVPQDSLADPPKSSKNQRFRNGKQVHHMDIDKELLAAPIKSAKDKFALIPEFLKVRGLVKQHLDSFNYFVNTGIKKIVRANDRIVSGVDPSIWLRYSAPIRVDVEYVEGSHDQKRIVTRKAVEIARMPIMLRSCCCTLYGKTEYELAILGKSIRGSMPPSANVGKGSCCEMHFANHNYIIDLCLEETPDLIRDVLDEDQY